MSTFFIGGIDTDIGKTIITGMIAKQLQNNGQTVISQKIVQSGAAQSDDIALHRQIMGTELLPEDLTGLTVPYKFDFAASPHLAARLENKEVDSAIITEATKKLEKQYDTVLLEGIGGLLVPLSPSLNQLDYIAQQNYPIILVTSPKLGSINHTLMSIEVILNRGIELRGLIYNRFNEDNKIIADDSKQVFADFLSQQNCPAQIVDCYDIKSNQELEGIVEMLS